MEKKTINRRYEEVQRIERQEFYDAIGSENTTVVFDDEVWVVAYVWDIPTEFCVKSVTRDGCGVTINGSPRDCFEEEGISVSDVFYGQLQYITDAILDQK